MTGSSSRSGTAERPAEQPVELVRREAAVGRGSRGDIALGQDVAGLEIPRGDEHLAHLPERGLLGRQRPLYPVAERRGHAPQVADELAHALGHERERVVRSLQRVREREVLLHHARTEHVRDERHRDAVLVVREADHELRVALAQGRDHAQLELLGGRRVDGGALEQAHLCVDRRDRLDGAVDVVHGRAAGRHDHRLADRCDVAEQRRVAEVSRSGLVRGHVEVGEEVGARLVEGRREQRHTGVAGRPLELDVCVTVELERLAVLAVGRAEGVLVVVRRLVRRPRVERAVVPLLELHRIDTALFRREDELAGLLHRALVVVADLGDDVAVAVVRDAGAVDDEFAHGVRGRRRDDDGTPRIRRHQRQSPTGGSVSAPARAQPRTRRASRP